MEKIDSHVQISKAIIKNFANNGSLFSYNINENKIIKDDASFNAIENYYTPELDKEILGALYEQPFGKVRKKIKLFYDKINTELVFDKNDIDIIRKYIKTSMLRGEKTINIAKNESAFSSIIDRNILHEMMIRKGLEYNEIDIYLSEYIPTLIINKTDDNFVINKNCFYTTEIIGMNLFIIPVNPKYVIAMGKENEIVNFRNKYDCDFIFVNEVASIYNMNNRAYRYEKNVEGNFLLSISEKELNLIQEYVINQIRN